MSFSFWIFKEKHYLCGVKTSSVSQTETTYKVTFSLMSRWVLRPPIESWGELFLGSMKDSILGFNQAKVLSLVKEVKDEKTEKITTISIDVEDLLILSIIADLSNRKSIRKVILEDGQYSWISYNLILEDLPILRIDKKQLRRRLDKLVEFDLIDLKVERVNGSGTFVYIKIGQIYEELKYGKADENMGGQKSTGGMDKNVYGDGQKSTPKDSSIKQVEEDNKERIDKSIPKKKAKFDVYADLSYVDAAYADVWKEWLEYKDAINKQYKTQKGANMQYSSMIRMSDNNPVLANAIIKRSIEMSWDGLSSLTDKQKKFFLSDRSPYYSNDICGKHDTKPSLPKGWEQERYDMYIRNGYTITEDGRLFKDGREIK